MHQTKIVCQSYDLGKLMYQFTQNEAHIFAFHLLGLGFWMFVGSHCFSTINGPWSLILTYFRGMELQHLLSEVRYHCPSQFISISICKHISIFYSNEMKYCFCCIFVCVVISVICCIPI